MNVGVISPKALIRTGLCALLSRIPGVTSVLDLDGSVAALERLKKAVPDVLLVDSADPATDFEVLSRAQTLLPQTRVLILTDDSDDDYQLQAIRQEARGFVSRNCPPEVFERALKQVARGELWIGHGLTSRIIGRLLQSEANHDSGGTQLSRREQEVLSLLADGYRNKEIASILAVSDNTIRAHVSSLYRKIHVSGRVEAALYYFAKAKKNGRLASPSPPSPADPVRAENSPAAALKMETDQGTLQAKAS